MSWSVPCMIHPARLPLSLTSKDSPLPKSFHERAVVTEQGSFVSDEKKRLSSPTRGLTFHCMTTVRRRIQADERQENHFKACTLFSGVVLLVAWLWRKLSDGDMESQLRGDRTQPLEKD